MNDSTLMLLTCLALIFTGHWILGMVALAWACWAVTYEAKR